MATEVERSTEILVVDDDAALRATLVDFLEGQGFTVSCASDVEHGRASFARRPPALVLLDLNMPGGDGLSLASEIRVRYGTPLIIISGRGDTIDRVVGLEVGADDYLAKPFELRELLARIRALLRRSVGPCESTPVVSAKDRTRACAQFGDGWALNLECRVLIAPGGRRLRLTSAEFILLAMFVERPNRVLSRDQIAALTRREDWDSFDRSIDTQISRLRRKLEGAACEPSPIQTVRGEGYVFAGPVSWREG